MGVSVVVVYMFDKPLAQCIIILCVIACNFVYLIITRPQVSVFEKVTSPVDMLCVMTIVGFMI